MARKGLYANIHAKRKRGEAMRKKGAKGAPTAAQIKRAKQTVKKIVSNDAMAINITTNIHKIVGIKNHQ